jgi:hypothetical protein
MNEFSYALLKEKESVIHKVLLRKNNLCKSVHGEDQNYFIIECWYYYLSLEFSKKKPKCRQCVKIIISFFDLIL